MKLYLSSYRLGDKVDYLKKWISENGRKILLIVNARDAKVQDETEKKKVLEKVATKYHHEVLNYESKSKCLSAIYNPSYGRNHRLCAPNKFYEALGLGKPVIVCKNTGIDKIVENDNLGIVIDFDVKQFYLAIRKFKNNDKICNQIEINCKQEYCELYLLLVCIILETGGGTIT